MFKMGCATADVTPGFKTYLRGYASRTRLTDTVEESIEAGIIALEKDSVKSIIITVDSLGIEYPYCRKITEAIAAKTNIAAENIIISCSHTHFAPGFKGFVVFMKDGELPIDSYPEDTAYFDFWMSKVMPAVEHAIADMEEVRLLQADITVSSVAFNRRTVRKSDGGVTTNYVYPADPENYDIQPIDQVMHVWKFMRGTSPKAVLARFGCHPVTGGYDAYGISADYPWYFKKAIQKKLNCPGFFMLGTAGDVVPYQRNGESRADIGEVLASSIRLAERTFRDTTDFTMKKSLRMFDVVAPYLQSHSAEEVDAAWKAELVKAQQTGQYTEEFYMLSMNKGILEEFGSGATQLPIHLLQLGDRVIVGLPFEVLTMIGVNIRKEFADAAVVSCCGGYECYLPLEEDFPKGGYETDAGTVWAKNTGDNVVAEAIAALKEFKK